METGHTNPVDAGLSAELMGTGSTEVIIRPERLVQGGDKVEQGLPATLITQWVFSILRTLPQSKRKRTRDIV